MPCLEGGALDSHLPDGGGCGPSFCFSAPEGCIPAGGAGVLLYGGYRVFAVPFAC